MKARTAQILQFGTYLASGGTATALNYISYLLLLWLGVYYVAASVASDAVGIASAFLLHKYGVFRVRGTIVRHAVRFVALCVWNILVISAILYATVEFFGIPEEVGKVIGFATVFTWNFLVLKFLVYT